MTDPIFSLRVAIRTVLISDPAILSALSGARIYDAAPAGETPPYITFGDASAEDWSTSDSRGHQHQFVLDVWSREGGDSEALEISALVASDLDGATPLVSGHRVIALRLVTQSIDRPTSDGLRHARLSFEAITERIETI